MLQPLHMGAIELEEGTLKKLIHKPVLHEYPIEHVEKSKEIQVDYQKLIYIPIYAVFLLSIIFIFYYFVQKDLALKPIHSLEDVKLTYKILKESLDKNQDLYILFGLFSCVYIFNQTFALPGSSMMNLLAGSLLGPFIGVPFVATLTAIGATSAYFISNLSGKELMKKHFEHKVEMFSKIIHSQSDHHLVVYLIGLRIFPFTPNWFLNYASPVVNINLKTFFLTTFLGLIPFHIVSVNAGKFLSEINSTSDIIQPKLILFFILLSLLLVLPLKMKDNEYFIKIKSFFKIE
eukprot:gene490-8004_t